LKRAATSPAQRGLTPIGPATARHVRLHVNDVAFESYHMGIRSLQRVASSYGSRRPSYAALYFGSSPSSHRAAWRRLAAPGDY
jgi:hypothetical protein